MNKVKLKLHNTYLINILHVKLGEIASHKCRYIGNQYKKTRAELHVEQYPPKTN